MGVIDIFIKSSQGSYGISTIIFPILKIKKQNKTKPTNLRPVEIKWLFGGNSWNLDSLPGTHIPPSSYSEQWTSRHQSAAQLDVAVAGPLLLFCPLSWVLFVHGHVVCLHCAFVPVRKRWFSLLFGVSQFLRFMVCPEHSTIEQRNLPFSSNLTFSLRHKAWRARARLDLSPHLCPWISASVYNTLSHKWFQVLLSNAIGS